METYCESHKFSLKQFHSCVKKVHTLEGLGQTTSSSLVFSRSRNRSKSQLWKPKVLTDEPNSWTWHSGNHPNTVFHVRKSDYGYFSHDHLRHDYRENQVSPGKNSVKTSCRSWTTKPRAFFSFSPSWQRSTMYCICASTWRRTKDICLYTQQFGTVLWSLY